MRTVWIATALVVGFILLATFIVSRKPVQTAQTQQQPILSALVTAQPPSSRQAAAPRDPGQARPTSGDQAVVEPEIASPEPPSPPRVATLKIGKLAGAIQVTMPNVAQDRRISLVNTCYRKNLSPAVRWSNLPRGTRSVVVTLSRTRQGAAPDQVWALFNIDPDLSGLAEGQAVKPPMKRGANIYGNAEYSGPCEAKGETPYALVVYAMDTMLDLPEGVSRNDLVDAMSGHVLDAANISLIHRFR